MVMKVPLNPIGKKDIHLLETALLISSFFDPEILEKIKDPSERLTWVDSLATAAAAFARRKAGMSIPEIAEELGRSEATIRNHLEGKTEAGKIIERVYQNIAKAGGEIKFEIVESKIEREKIEKIKKTIEEIIQKLEDILKEI